MNHLSTITRPNNKTPDANSTTAADCVQCGTKDSWIIHNVRLRGIYRRLCTSCVLRLHPGSFCPYCFTFYDSSLPAHPSKRLACSNCSSHTHTHCAPNHPPAVAFLCPPCADPNFNFLNLDRTKNRAIDKQMATVLLCAAKIAAFSMAKAEAVSRGDAERRVREAAVCRKRAREALEHVALVAKRKEVEESVEVSGNLVKSEKGGSGLNVEKVKSNGNVENGFKVEKNPISSHGSITVKEEGGKS